MSMPTGLRWERGTNGRTFRRFERSTGETVLVQAPINLYDDFLGDVLQDPWNAALGSDASGNVPAVAIIAGQLGGLLRLTTGDSSSSGTQATHFAADSVMLNSGLNFKCGSLYDLNLEVKIRSNTAITNRSIGVGFTDVHSTTGSLEEPASGSTTSLVTNATDGCGFLFDSLLTAQTFHVWGVANDTDSVFYNTTVAPVADTFNILRLQLARDATLRAWIDGVLVKEQASAVTGTVALGPYVTFCTSGTGAVITSDIDYVRIWAAR